MKATPDFLLVIDMQYDFWTHEVCLSDVANTVKGAVARGIPIVLLEYTGYGDTHADIMQHLEGYENYSIQIKNSNGGGQEALVGFEELGFFPNDFEKTTLQIAGVNTCYCVYSTIDNLLHELSEYDMNFYLSEKDTACTCRDDQDCFDGLSYTIERRINND